MSRTNSHSTYGSVTKTFHWVTALLIFAVMPLGIIASRAPTGTEPEIARVFTLFSLHKTIGVTQPSTALPRSGGHSDRTFHLSRKTKASPTFSEISIGSSPK